MGKGEGGSGNSASKAVGSGEAGTWPGLIIEKWRESSRLDKHTSNESMTRSHQEIPSQEIIYLVKDGRLASIHRL